MIATAYNGCYIHAYFKRISIMRQVLWQEMKSRSELVVGSSLSVFFFGLHFVFFLLCYLLDKLFVLYCVLFQ